MLRIRVILLLVAPLAGCGQSEERGNHAAIASSLISTRCAACHRIPGIRNATGRVGPSLDGIAGQQVLAGHFPNTRNTMVRWIMEPQRMLPGNAMQDTGLTRAQAELVADYLYTLD